MSKKLLPVLLVFVSATATFLSIVGNAPSQLTYAFSAATFALSIFLLISTRREK